MKSELRRVEKGLCICSSSTEDYFCYIKRSVPIPVMAHSCTEKAAFRSFLQKNLHLCGEAEIVLCKFICVYKETYA